MHHIIEADSEQGPYSKKRLWEVQFEAAFSLVLAKQQKIFLETEQTPKGATVPCPPRGVTSRVSLKVQDIYPQELHQDRSQEHPEFF